MITYDELDLVTTVGQSGSPLLLIKSPPKSMVKAEPHLPPDKSHEIL